MDNKTKQGFYSTCLTHFDPLLTRVWPCLSTISYSSMKTRVQSLSPLYFPLFELTLSLMYPDPYFHEGKMKCLHGCGLWPTRGKSLLLTFWNGFATNVWAKQAAAVLCVVSQVPRAASPASLLGFFGIPERAVSPSSTSHSAPWARSSLKLQQTFILELRNSDLCLSGCFDRKRTWGLTRDEGQKQWGREETEGLSEASKDKLC